METRPIYCTILSEELVRRQSKNSSYSLRSFARDLKISAGALSQILKGKRPLTSEKATELTHNLKFDDDLEEKFLSATSEDQENRTSYTFKALKRIKEKFRYTLIKPDSFAMIRDWHHLAILNLVKLNKFENSTKWIASQLGIKELVAKRALSRLKRMGLLKEENGTIARSSSPIETPSDIPSEDIRHYQSQIIKRSLDSLKNESVMNRDITSIMFNLDKDKLSEAKKRIQVFRKEMAEFCTSENADQVYSLSVQLFPQSKGNEENEENED